MTEFNDKFNSNNTNAEGNGSNDGQPQFHYDFGRRPQDLTSAYERELNKLRSEPDHNQSGRPKRKSVRGMFAAFMAGAVVVGGLMYGADQGNWFSAGSGDSSPAAVAASVLQDAGITTASSKSVESNISDIYEMASPAVVKIENYGVSQQSMYDSSYFNPFFGGMGGRGQQGQQEQQDDSQADLELTGEGSGFFFDKSGYILTNQHVIDGAKELKVTVQGYDEPLTATVVGSSEDLDLAVLKVEGNGDFASLELGDSDDSQIGEWVIAIGNPYGFDHTMTVGVLSAKERPITITNDDGSEHLYEHLLQTDASINPGNSGGPLLNASGQVIGINTAVNSEAQGIGFAIPTSTIKDVLQDLMTNSL